jgi:hypothetical protein
MAAASVTDVIGHLSDCRLKIALILSTSIYLEDGSETA